MPYFRSIVIDGDQRMPRLPREEGEPMHASKFFAGRCAPALLFTLAALAGGAQAGTHSFTGSLSTDDQLVTILLDLPVSGDITATTLSHSGGTNAAGQVIAAGGFAPVLTLFDDSGTNVMSNIRSSNSCPGAAGSFCWDASFTYAGAPAGHYTLVLSQDGNTPNGLLAAGFAMTGRPHYTGEYRSGIPDDPAYTFIQIDSSQRSGQWALDLSVPAGATAVPEPGATSLLAAGLVVVAFARRRRVV